MGKRGRCDETECARRGLSAEQLSDKMEGERERETAKREEGGERKLGLKCKAEQRESEGDGGSEPGSRALNGGRSARARAGVSHRCSPSVQECGADTK